MSIRCTVLFVISVLVYITDGAVYLKPVVRHIMILEGKELTINWVAYNEDDRLPPCHWDYAFNNTGTTETFMAFDLGQRFEFGNKGPWQFTRTQDPCKGGIRKLVKLEDSGVYMMLLDSGYRLKRDDSQTTVEVYQPGRLKFKVIVNGLVNELDLGRGSSIDLPLLETSKPVNVSVKIGDVFPPTTVSITRDARQKSCDNMYEMCTDVIDFKEVTDAPIIISISTGIIGADPVIISQPVIYTSPVDNTERNMAIAFGVLFFLFLVAIIAIIIRLVLVGHKIRKRDHDQEVDPKKKCPAIHTLLSCLSNTFLDLKAAFSMERETSQSKADMNNDGALEILIPNHDKEYEKKDQEVAVMKESLQQKVHNLLERCDNIIENVKTNDEDDPELCLKLPVHLKSDLEWVKGQLERCDENLSTMRTCFRQQQMEASKGRKASRGGIEEARETDQMIETNVTESCDKIQCVPLTHLLVDLDEKKTFLEHLHIKCEEIEQTIDDVESRFAVSLQDHADV